MASVQFTDVQARPSEFLELTSLTCRVKIFKHPFSQSFTRLLSLPLFRLLMTSPVPILRSHLTTHGEGMPHGLEDDVGLYFRLCR